MRREVNLGWLLVAILGASALLFGLFLLLREDPAEQPYLKVLGSSFIFNYREADVYMGFTAVPVRPIPVGSVVEVSFQNPAGGAPLVVEKQTGLPDRRISLRSPSVRGVEAGVPYDVTLRLLARETRAELWRHSFTISSNIGDEVVPDKPLTVGPGYHRPRQ